MAPFHMPWITFTAFLVLLATIVLALVWAIVDKLGDKTPDGEDAE